MRHVFVSYAPEDAEFAALLANRFEKSDFAIWRRQLGPSGELAEVVETGIREALGVIAVLSPASVQSPSRVYEWAFALGCGVPVLPVLSRVGEVDLHPRLRTLQHLDFSSGVAQPWEALITALQKIESAEKHVTIHVPRDAPPVIQQAARALDSLNEEQRLKALKTLGQMDDIAVVGVLAEAILHPVRQVRFEAAIHLAKYRDERAAPVLLDGIRQGYESIGQWMLGNIGPAAVPALIEATRDADRRVQDAACTQLGRIATPEAVAALVDALSDSGSTRRHQAASGLGYAADPSAIPALLALAHDPEREVRRAVIGTLVKCGQKAGTFDRMLPYLTGALDDEDDQVAINATLGLLESRDPLAVAALVRTALTNENEQVRSFSRSAVGKLAEIAAPDLREAASNPEALVRHRAIYMLSGMADTSDLELFLRAARDPDARVRSGAVSGLHSFGSKALPALIERLHDDDRQIVFQAVVSLGQIGDSGCIPALIECLEGDDDAAERAASTLGWMDSRKARAAAHAWERENRQ